VRRLEGPSARAVSLAAVGVAAVVASRGFGTGALAILGVGLVALPVIVTVLVWAASAGLRVERRVEPARCAAGEPVAVRVSLRGWATGIGLDRLLDVSIDPGVDGAAAGGAPTRTGERSWRLRAVRGEHHLPPARVRVGDPFGLAARTRRGDPGPSLLVVPRAPALEGAPVGARARGMGARRRRADSGFGELDRVRDYQAGDALSRIHWGQTAKRGRLQTKELRAADGAGRSVLLLLDGAVGAGQDLETTVSAAAALARHLAGRGEPVALVHTGAPPLRLASGQGGWPAIEVALARFAPGGDRALALAVRAEATSPEAPELIVVLTCAADPALAGAAVQARAIGVGVAAVLVGPAAASAGELAGLGVEVVVVPAADRLAEALGGATERARALR
jgi:uncharacterized protein (DUF58 family)